MPNDKPLEPDDFPVEVDSEQLVTADGKPIAETEDVADHFNEDDCRNEQDRWSA